ncbi:Uncharacterized protein family UPF0497 [Macleaya cordata]|uniref:CASP-like protein n=1 Tax=Macleaya cordata TaxID=56857 RepID=A0A200QX65_MACCD|nr:Uncharacterized protein family UPF0497 [Macleaya cordata]
MASTEATDNTVKESVAKTEPESQISTTATTTTPLFSLGLCLRKLLFWTMFVAAIVMLTSKQTEKVFWPPSNSMVPRTTKYSHYPAFK